MQGPVTLPTDGNEIIFGIMPELTSRNDVVDFQAKTRSARLTTPSVSLQYCSMQRGVLFGRKTEPRLFSSIHNLRLMILGDSRWFAVAV